MTVAELLDRIIAAYQGATPEAMGTYKPVFHARFKVYEGDRLEQATLAVLAEFKPTMRQPFPIPKDFEQHLPSLHRDMPKDEGPKLDFAARSRRADEIMAQWRAEQAGRAANGVPDVLKALEEIAQPLALVMGWNQSGDRLLLSRKQVKVAIQRAISIERRKRHGMPPAQPAVWWSQISAIADEWKIEITPEWWSDEAARTLNRMEAA